MKQFFSKLTLGAWVSVVLTAVLIFTTVATSARGGSLCLLALSMFAVLILALEAHEYNSEKGHAKEFRRPKAVDLKAIRASVIEGIAGILISTLVLIYGQIIEKIVAFIIIYVTIRLLALIIEQYKECSSDVRDN